MTDYPGERLIRMSLYIDECQEIGGSGVQYIELTTMHKFILAVNYIPTWYNTLT